VLLLTPASRPVRSRDLFVTGPGPDSGSSRPFRDVWFQVWEKSGTGVAVCVMLLVGCGAAVCPQAGEAEAASTSNKRKSRRAFMPTSDARGVHQQSVT
jgi:hypothetical protein